MFFDEQFSAHVGVRYPFNNGKDAAIIKGLREIYSDEQIQIYMAAFFALEDDFVEQSGYGLGVFRGCLPKVIAHVNKGQRADKYGHVPPCARVDECIRRALREGREEQTLPGLRSVK